MRRNSVIERRSIKEIFKLTTEIQRKDTIQEVDFMSGYVCGITHILRTSGKISLQSEKTLVKMILEIGDERRADLEDDSFTDYEDKK